MRLSIVTPTFNQGHLIGQAIESVLDQPAWLDLEYLIIDGGSTDSTRSVVESYRPQLQARGILFKFVSEPDRGQSDAINKGVRLSSGQLLGCLCSDDFFESQVLGHVVREFIVRPEAQWGYGGWRFVDYDRHVFSTTHPAPYKYRNLAVVCNIGMPSCFYRKDFFLAIGQVNPDLHLSMDYDLWFRMARRAPPMVLPMVVANMRYYQQTKSATKTLAHLRESLLVQEKYTRAWGMRALQWLYFLRGLGMIFARRDVTTRVERWRRWRR